MTDPHQIAIIISALIGMLTGIVSFILSSKKPPSAVQSYESLADSSGTIKPAIKLVDDVFDFFGSEPCAIEYGTQRTQNIYSKVFVESMSNKKSLFDKAFVSQKDKNAAKRSMSFGYDPMRDTITFDEHRMEIESAGAQSQAEAIIAACQCTAHWKMLPPIKFIYNLAEVSRMRIAVCVLSLIASSFLGKSGNDAAAIAFAAIAAVTLILPIISSIIEVSYMRKALSLADEYLAAKGHCEVDRRTVQLIGSVHVYQLSKATAGRGTKVLCLSVLLIAITLLFPSLL